MDITAITAISGLIIASIALGWNIYRDISERPRLKISCCFRPKSKDFKFSGVNKGRCTIFNPGGSYMGGQAVAKPNQTTNNVLSSSIQISLPKKLEPAESFEFARKWDDLFPDNLWKEFDGIRITEIYFTNTFNKKCKIPKKQLKKLNKDLEEFTNTNREAV